MQPSILSDLPSDDLKRVLKGLSVREREALKLIAGLGNGYTYTEEEVAHIFKVTRQRIRQIITKAMRKVERRLERRANKEQPDIHQSAGIDVSVALPEYCDEEFVAQKLVEFYIARKWYAHWSRGLRNCRERGRIDFRDS